MDESVDCEQIVRYGSICQVKWLEGEVLDKVHLAHLDSDISTTSIDDVVLFSHGLDEELGAWPETSWSPQTRDTELNW